jgi:hypothetical protein
MRPRKKRVNPFPVQRFRVQVIVVGIGIGIGIGIERLGLKFGGCRGYILSEQCRENQKQ